jgi:hypothetical protein
MYTSLMRWIFALYHEYATRRKETGIRYGSVIGICYDVADIRFYLIEGSGSLSSTPTQL